MSVLLTVLILTIISVAGASFGPNGEDLSWYTIDGGGQISSTGGGFELSATIGQPDAGQMSGGNFQLTGGFWFEQPPGDCNSTGSINLLDYTDLEACLAGPNDGLGAGCECFDFDADGDLDLVDFANFQTFFTGPLP